MTDRLVFAAVADDDTGASDLAGMLAEAGMRTLLVIDCPPEDKFRSWCAGYEAAVVATGTRNMTPAESRAHTATAVRLLKTRDPRLIQIKYCSTFDSTPEGNIGPSIDAALDELGETFTVALPALPVNGRTTYQGHLFVRGVALADSPMRDHPLTPMTDSDLVRWLGRQTRRRVGLVPYEVVEAGAARVEAHFQTLRERGVAIAVVDCLNDEHLKSITRAAVSLRLITGSSAFGMALPAALRERDQADKGAAGTKAAGDAAFDPGDGYGCLLVAGSCSVATRAQNEWLIRRGCPTGRVDPIDLLGDGSGRQSIVARVRAHLTRGEHFLLTTTDEPEAVRSVQEWGAGRGLPVPALGERIARALADLVREILRESGAGGLIVAGGETSGAVCRRLEFGALRVGRNIDPGVPLCLPLEGFRRPVALKSGNFGGQDFYDKALRAVAESSSYLS